MAKRNRKPLRCAHCGAEFPRTSCAGLFCGDDCKAEHEAQMKSTREGLDAAGFTQHETVPNLWVKDGMAIGEEHAKQVGLEKVLALHAQHVEGARLAQSEE